MDKQWFVLHTLTGQENKAQKSIEARVKLERMEDYIGRCEIPTEKVSEKKNGKKRKNRWSRWMRRKTKNWFLPRSRLPSPRRIRCRYCR